MTPSEGNSTPDRQPVIRALAQLSAEHRAVICRSHYQGLTTAQIAADLGIAEGAVKSQLHCALHALRQVLQQEDCHRSRRNRPFPPTIGSPRLQR